MRILTVNTGSTSVKVSMLDGGERTHQFGSLHEALALVGDVDAVAHRVVHGGDRVAATLLDDGVMAELRELVELAPLHQGAALDAIEQCRRGLPETPQVACFDTAFHTTIPMEARTYALPGRLREKVKVYGFHGLSHEWAAVRVAQLAPDATRMVIAHLGGGQSLCGVLDGRSVTTTMGFTPLDGLVMATRSGALDPGALLWLQRHTDEDLPMVLERESGLFGLCGSSDMRAVIDRCGAGDADARFALDVYLHRLIAYIGSTAAILGGLDALVFTGGIGANASVVRELVADRLRWLGIEVDPQATGEEISARGIRNRTFVIEAREDLQMAHHTAATLGLDGS